MNPSQNTVTGQNANNSVGAKKQKKIKPLEDQDKDAKLASWLIPLIFAIVIVFNTGIIIYRNIIWTTQNTSQAVSVFKYLKQNLLKDPIQAVAQVSTSSSCPDGYEKVVIDKFPGISSGCLCDENDEVSIVSGTCPSTCDSVTEVSEENLYAYQNYSYCVKRLKNYQYLEKEGTCPDDKPISCNDLLCIQSNDTCPITAITQVVTSGTQQTATQHNQEKKNNLKGIKHQSHMQNKHNSASTTSINTLVFSASKQIFQYSDDENDLYIDLQALFTSGQCYDQSIIGSFNDQKMYPFVNYGSSQLQLDCGDLGIADQYGEYLDQQYVGSYWTQNKIPKLPDLSYYMSYNDKVQLVAIKRISINPLTACFNVSPEQMAPMIQSYESMRVAILNFSILLFLFGLVSIVLCVVDILFDKGWDQQLHKVMAVLGYLSVLFSIIMTIIFRQCVSSQDYNSVFQALINNQCFNDSTILLQLDVSIQFINNVVNQSSQSLAMNLLFSLIFVAFNVWIIFKKKTIDKQRKSQLQEQDQEK